MIIPIKVQCGCGQKYAFDVEPVNGRMPQGVNCPACGANGTPAADEIIRRTLATQAPQSPSLSVNRPATPYVPPAVAPIPSNVTKAKVKKSKAALWIIGGVALAAVVAGLIWWKLQSGNQREVNRLESAMKKAFADKNPQLLLDQYYWEGTSDKDKQGMSESVSSFVTSGTLTKVSFTPNASGKAETEMKVAGVILRPNLPIVGSIDAEIVFDGKIKISNKFPVGEINGRMWIPGGGSFNTK